MCPPLIALIPAAMTAMGASAATATAVGAAATTAAGIAAAAAPYLAAAGAVAGGIAQKQQADFQSKQAQTNADIALQKARDEEVQGQHERDALRLNAAQMLGEGRVGFAGGNIMVGGGTGTSFNWEQDLARSLELDLAQSRENATRRATGLERESTNFMREASSLRAAGRNAMVAGVIQGGSSLLGGLDEQAYRKRMLGTTPAPGVGRAVPLSSVPAPRIRP